MSSRQKVRQGRAMRVLAAAPRILDSSYASPKVRLVPVILSRHRISTRRVCIRRK